LHIGRFGWHPCGEGWGGLAAADGVTNRRGMRWGRPTPSGVDGARLATAVFWRRARSWWIRSLLLCVRSGLGALPQAVGPAP